MESRSQTVGHWSKENILGKGGFGIVTQWRNLNTGEMIALKLFRTDGSNKKYYREKLLMEIENIKRLSHPNLAKILPMPDDMSDQLSENLIVICMEYCTGGDLRKVLNKPENCSGLPERTIRKLLRDIKNGVEYLHKCGVTHGDIKPENVVLQEVNEDIIYKLIDLGHQRELDQNRLYSSYTGTLQYLAPEVLIQCYSSSVDYWSMGVVCHEIITGFRPFPSDIPPMKWSTLIKSKDFEEICIYKNLDGELEFSKHLPQEHHISQFLKDEFEYWLRLSLEWDGKIRGRGVNNDIIIFKALDSILDKKIITIFTIVAFKQLSYEIDNSTAISTLKGWIQRDSKHLVNDQIILLPTGETLNDESLAWNCWDSTNEVAMAYVFSKTALKLPSEELVIIPDLVTTIIEEPKKLFEYYIIRKIWSQAVYFIRNQLYLCSTFLEAVAVKLLSLLKKIEDLTNLDATVTSEIQQAIGKMKLCNDSMTYNEENFKKNFGNQSENKNTINDWRKKSKILHEHLSQIYAIAKTLTSKITTAKYNFERVQAVHDNCLEYEEQLQKILDASYRLYKSLHTMPKELRKSESNSIEMAALVNKTLEVRNNFLQNEHLENNLKFIGDCENEMLNLTLPLEEFSNSVKELSKDIVKFHLIMLQDIWEASLTKNPATTEVPTTDDTTQKFSNSTDV